MRKLLAIFTVFVSASLPAFASDGFEVAGRHSLVLSGESSVVLGNGSVGCLVLPPSEDRAFLEGTLIGEHWRIAGPNEEATPAFRVILARLRVELAPNDSSLPPIPPFLPGALLRRDENLIMSRLSGSGQTLAATFTVQPTRNLFILRAASNFPVSASVSVDIPEIVTPQGETVSATREVSGTRGLLALTQPLPRLESFGLAVAVQGATVTTATSARGGRVALNNASEWDLRLEVVPQDEAAPLRAKTLAAAREIASLTREGLADHRRRPWREFWTRSVVDFSGSTAPEAREMENAWARLNHALAIQAGGSIPPADCGFGAPRNGGRIWNSVLWPLYRGWLLSNHAEDVRCLDYPRLFTFPEGSDSSDQPLLSSESGPDGVSPERVESLATALAKIGLVTEGVEWDERGRLFSTIPLLVTLPSVLQERDERVENVYPFLFRNANHAARILAATGEELDHDFQMHLLASIEAALKVAEKIGIDRKARERWQEVVENTRKSLAPDDLEGAADNLRLLGGREAPGTLEQFTHWLSGRRFAPEGTLLNEKGERSLLATGWALSRLLALLLHEERGTIRLLPGIPMDGAWSVQAQGLSTSSGVEIGSLTLKRGVLDPFLLRAGREGSLRVVLPRGWSSARVARVDEPHPVEDLRVITESQGGEDRKLIQFTVKEGGGYLVGPVW